MSSEKEIHCALYRDGGILEIDSAKVGTQKYSLLDRAVDQEPMERTEAVSRAQEQAKTYNMEPRHIPTPVKPRYTLPYNLFMGEYRDNFKNYIDQESVNSLAPSEIYRETDPRFFQELTVVKAENRLSLAETVVKHLKPRDGF